MHLTANTRNTYYGILCYSKWPVICGSKCIRRKRNEGKVENQTPMRLIFSPRHRRRSLLCPQECNGEKRTKVKIKEGNNRGQPCQNATTVKGETCHAPVLHQLNSFFSWYMELFLVCLPVKATPDLYMYRARYYFGQRLQTTYGGFRMDPQHGIHWHLT